MCRVQRRDGRLGDAWLAGDLLVLEVTDGEHLGRVRFRDARPGRVARKRMSIARARAERVEEVIIC